MKINRIGFLGLISELENDIDILGELMSKYTLINNKIKRIEPDEFDWAALGYTIHNIYNMLENYFLRISKFFENHLEQTFWHKDLVNKMTIEIDGVRPKLFARDLAFKINELRAFRHIFRYIYQSELDIDKLQNLNTKIPEIINEFKPCHNLFIKKIKKIVDSL